MNEDENTGTLDAIIGEGGNAATGEGISTGEDKTDYKALAESYRIRAEKAEAKAKAKKEPAVDAETIRNEARATIREELDSQYLDDAEYPDDVKDAIKLVAKMNNVSMRVAEKDPYVKYKVEQAIQEQRFNASAVRNARNSAPVENAGEFLDPSKFDLNTEEGRAKWKEAKAKRVR